jgi:TPR repeat protein
MADSNIGGNTEKGSFKKWVTKSAENGYPKAQSVLGYYYFKGEKVEKNKEKSKYWLNKLLENPEVPADMKKNARTFMKIKDLD